MQSFLGQLSQSIIQTHGDHIDQIAIVLPSRRSHLFLRKEFGKRLKKSTWLPHLYSLEDFIDQHHTSLQIIDSLDLSYELYLIHLEIEGKNAEPYEEFINWSNTLIQDFNEIDRYLIDATELYAFLSEARALETWNLESAKLTDFQKKYLNFWSKLIQYYEKFKTALLKKNLAYQGLSFRKAAENIEKNPITQHKKIYFAGFNALTLSEKVILDYYKNEQGAELIYDVDDYYLSQREQEAGRFLRPKSKEISEEWINKGFKKDDKEISIYSVSGNIQQAKLIGELCQESQINQTAIILADESILIPVLESLPSNVDKVNVTMGYELKNSPYYDFFLQFIQLHLAQNEDQKNYHSRGIIRFFSHPLWKRQNHSVLQASDAILDKVAKMQWNFLPTDALDDLNQKLNYNLFEGINRPIESIIQALNWLCENQVKSAKEIASLDAEIIHAFHLNFNRLLSFEERLNEKLDIKALSQLFQQLVSQETVSFIGEPLSGLQVMGVLESRSLDFERIIISSLNESILPAGKAQNSFIPYDIKRKFGLPSYKEKDAIFAYHFYRSIQKAREIHLLHNNFQDGLGGAEKSRFLVQLENEVKNYNPNITLKHYSPKQTKASKESGRIEIETNKNIQEKVLTHLKSGISASAINTFLNCPLDYYYRYILQLKEPEENNEIMQLNIFGSIVHQCLEDLYHPFLNRELDANGIQSIYDGLNNKLKLSFLKEINKSGEKGFDKIAFEAALVYVKRIIDWDNQAIQSGNTIKIHGLEKKFITDFNGNLLKGTIDRIDEYNGQLRLIDYKTGSLESKDLSFGSIETLKSGSKDKVIQLLIYLIAVREEYPGIQAGMISCKSEEPKFLSLKVPDNHSSIEEILDEILSLFGNLENSFKHNKKSTTCSFCLE